MTYFTCLTRDWKCLFPASTISFYSQWGFEPLSTLLCTTATNEDDYKYVGL